MDKFDQFDYNGYWMIITLHDERYDFNFHLRTIQTDFKGVEKYVSNYFSVIENLNLEKHVDMDSGCVYFSFHDSNRLDYLEDKNYETVHFKTVIVIPLMKGFKDLEIVNSIVSRNVKHGFLDVKENF